MEKFIAYTKSWERPNEADANVAFRTWSGEHEPPSHSLPTAIGSKVAETFGPEAWHRFHLALMAAYFTDNRTVSDVPVMSAVADAVGIDAAAFETTFASRHDEFAHQVIDEHNEAIGVGVTGVPCVVINDAFPVTGAQDLDFYRRMIDNILTREAQQPD